MRLADRSRSHRWRSPVSHRRPVTAAAASRGFASGQRGAVTIGAAISISILVAALAIFMSEIVHKIYVKDRLGLGARAAARAVSLAATAPANEKALETIVCDAVGRELGKAAGSNCACRWQIDVESFATPQSLLSGSTSTPDGSESLPYGGANGDMVLIRLHLPYWDWLLSAVPAAAPAGAEGDEENRCPDVSGKAVVVAAAVARNERAVRASR